VLDTMKRLDSTAEDAASVGAMQMEG
jgi:hypothetical protein